jgi:hypothetical protein
MLAAGRSAQAQYGPPGAAPPMPQGGYPAGYQAYPTQSPYQNLFEQTYQSDGMWYKDANNGFGPFSQRRDFFLNVDYTRSKTRDMRGIVGYGGAQTYHQQNDPENDQIVDGLEFYNYFNAASANMIPTITNNGMRMSGGFWNADGSGLLLDVSWGAEGTATFDARANALAGRLSTEEILELRVTQGRGSLARFNLNGQTDLGITTGEILGSGIPFDEADASDYGVFGSTSEVLDRTLLNLYGIPIGDGRTFADQDEFGGNGLGVTIPYDIQFLMEHRLSTFGSTIDGAFAPFYDRNDLKIRPIVGGRYLHVNEAFTLHVADSGLSYGVNNGDNDTPDNAKVFPVADGIDDDDDFIADNPAEEGGLTFNQINPSDPVIVRGFLESQVVSNLAGPEFGMHYMLGEGKGLSIIGHSKVAAMFNTERITLRGDNIFNHMNPDDPTTPTELSDGFDTNNLNGLTQNAFTDRKTTLHVSPLFEQSLTAEIPIFANMPVLRRVQLLEDAKLRLGWTFLLVGEIADPNQSVDYSAVNPRLDLFPQIQTERGVFTQNTFNVGINWNY